MVERKNRDGSKIVGARLSLVGEVEELLRKIHKKTSTSNDKSLKILLSVAVSREWKIKTGNLEKAFLQSDPTQCKILVKPPVESNLPTNKAFRLNKTAFSLLAAPRIYFLEQTIEFNNYDFQPLTTDPDLFTHSSNAISTFHTNDLLVAGEENIVDNFQHKTQEEFVPKPQEDLPRFSGLILKRSQQGELIIDGQHLADSMEIPDLNQQMGRWRKNAGTQPTTNFQKTDIKT